MIDRDYFFRTVRADRELFRGTLDQSQVDGMNALLDMWEKRFPPSADPRWLAYCLATAYHETDQAMQPVREYGLGRGHAYGLPAGKWAQCYYGRGDVQETWLANYQHANDRLHQQGYLEASDDLVKTPDLMLRPDVSAATLFLGMIEGWFTGRKLSNYFNIATNDPFNARRIINGIDCAQQITVYDSSFLMAILPVSAKVAA